MKLPDLSKLTCRIYGYGVLEVFLCQRLAEEFKEAQLFVPWMNAFPTPQNRWIGRNIPGVKRIYEFWEDLDSVDTFCFFDVGDQDIQQELRRQGRAVFGTGGRPKTNGKPGKAASELEIDRELFKKTLIKQGLRVPGWEILVGVDALRERAINNPGFYVKPNVGERGIFETFFVESYATAATEIDRIAHELMMLRDVTEFMIEDPIPGEEPGSDFFMSKGIAFKKGLYGVEQKGDGYICKVVDLSDMPAGVRKVNDAMAPVMKEYAIDGCISTEIRQGKDKIPHYIDGCMRIGNPPAAVISEIYKNFPHIVRAIAHGESIEPKFAATHAAELSVESTDADTLPVPLDLKDDYDYHSIKLRTVCKVGKQFWHIPYKKMGCTVAKAVGLGNSKEEAEFNALEAAENFKCPGKVYNRETFELLDESLKRAKKIGIDF